MVLPVLIVGAGPVGATLALELAGHGVRSLVAERSVAPSSHPKMDFLNARSMELLSRLNLVDEIRARGVAPEHDFTFHWSRTFTEPPVTTWSYPSVDGVRERIVEVNDGSSPAQPYQRIAGSILEDILRARLLAHPLVDLREGWRFVDFDAVLVDQNGPVAVLVDQDGAEHRIRAGYVVGCDGANSRVRERAGIPTLADGPTADHCDVYFTSADPALRKHGRYFLAILGGGLTLVSRDERDTWTAAFPLAPGAKTHPDPVATLVERLGIDVAIDEVINVAYWQGRLAVAENYRSGNVFVAGDAAHQFYPTGGHGANTGLADAIDLGWKLAGRLTGWGGEALLDSYEAERRPVALFNREMCFNLLEVWRRFPTLVAGGASRQQLAGFLAQDSYQIDNIGIHCGYRYDDSPVIWPEQGDPPPWEWRRIVPSTWPGARVPSLRLADGTSVYGKLGNEFTLVDLSGQKSGAPLAEEAIDRGLPLSYLPVDDDRMREIWERDLVLVRPDHHVAWRGNTPPAPWGDVIERVRGGGSKPLLE